MCIRIKSETQNTKLKTRNPKPETVSTNMRYSFLIIIFCLPLLLSAQKKDSLIDLVCPLNEAIEPPVEKKSYSLGGEDLKIVLTSPSDTIVKACTTAIITNIMREDAGTWTIMFNSADYYFLFSGITRTSVVKGQKVKAGEPIGSLKRGEKMILQIYDAETALDPRKYVSCVK